MVTSPVLLLLLFDLLLFVVSAFYFDSSEQKWENLLLSALFLFSGMPALIYQVVWQRVLFSIYGVNAESVAVVVSAFMLGLGLGSIAGGRLSSRFPRQGILIFGFAELGIAISGSRHSASFDGPLRTPRERICPRSSYLASCFFSSRPS